MLGGCPEDEPAFSRFDARSVVREQAGSLQVELELASTVNEPEGLLELKVDVAAVGNG